MKKSFFLFCSIAVCLLLVLASCTKENTGRSNPYVREITPSYTDTPYLGTFNVVDTPYLKTLPASATFVDTPYLRTSNVVDTPYLKTYQVSSSFVDTPYVKKNGK